jgi:hypothetical protein
MLGSCCGKPLARIIRVADFEAGLVGLDQAILNVYATGIRDEEEIKQELLRLIRDFGNYISPSRENDYKQALLREYKRYVASLQRESSQKNAQSQKR